jgi:hypothetical protein
MRLAIAQVCFMATSLLHPRRKSRNVFRHCGMHPIHPTPLGCNERCKHLRIGRSLSGCAAKQRTGAGVGGHCS